MWRFFSRFRLIILLSIFLAVPVLLVYTQRHAPRAGEFFSDAVLDMSSLVERTLIWASGGISDVYYRYMRALQNQDDILALRSQIEELQLYKVLLVESEIENQKLRKLIDFSTTLEGPKMMGASVIGRSGTPLTRSITIDKGEKSGIHRGDAVVSASGALGQVITSGRNSSKVLLITDPSSAIDVVVQRSRAHGILRGAGDARRYLLRVADFDRLHDIVKGDVIVTSGVGARFPLGIPVGEVTEVTRGGDGLYIEAEIKPFTPFERVEEILVLTQGENSARWHRRDIISSGLAQSLSTVSAEKDD